jgi:hypothetical protein
LEHVKRIQNWGRNKFIKKVSSVNCTRKTIIPPLVRILVSCAPSRLRIQLACVQYPNWNLTARRVDVSIPPLNLTTRGGRGVTLDRKVNKNERKKKMKMKRPQLWRKYRGLYYTIPSVKRLHPTEIIKLLVAVQRQYFAQKICRQFLTRELWWHWHCLSLAVSVLPISTVWRM